MAYKHKLIKKIKIKKYRKNKYNIKKRKYKQK
jgi:hypothetical protein